MAPLRTRGRTSAPSAARGGRPLLRIDHVQLRYWVDGRFNVALQEATFDIRPREKVIVIALGLREVDGC